MRSSHALREALWNARHSGSVGDALAATGAADVVVELAPFTVASGSSAGNASNGVGDLPLAPVFEYVPAAGAWCQVPGATMSSVPLQLDVLAFVLLAAPLAGDSGVHGALTAALRSQLSAMHALLAAQPQLVPLRALHFAPPGLGFPVSLVVPLAGPGPEACEAQLRPTRQRVHQLLGLPLNVPLLRFANALTFGSGEDGGAGAGNSKLRDVHATLPPPPVSGTVAVVSGSYDYHHYCQDRTNDAGWGCAYRSLQTLCSWFKVQGYTAKPPPSHSEVQATLARLGDKPPSFVGSSQWIGAIELSYVLDDYLGVTSKIVTVNRGADIPTHARQLAAHFATQGTPVMIGGGVLAYTLLGVAFNEDTGEAAFLILDPHYTGGEDLKKIHTGGWVAWKQLDDSAAAGGPLFVKDTFYNFLCPQRPSEV